MSNALRSYAAVSRMPQPEAMQISDCVNEITGDAVSPVVEFQDALKALALTSSKMSTMPNPSIMGEMLVVAAVASVESYFRGVLSSLAGICPLTVERLSSEKVAFGAAMAYPPRLLALALLERSLFSSHGVIAKEFSKFVNIDVLKFPEFRAAIESFDRACTCRHSVAHWRGAIDSETLRKLDVRAEGNRFRLDPNFSLVQRVFAASDHLVHVANEFLFNLTVRRWIDAGLLLSADSPRAESLSRCGTLLEVFGDFTLLKTPEDLLATLEESER